MSKENECPVCSSTGTVYEYPSEYLYENIGLANVILTGKGVSLTKCPDCLAETSLVLDEQQLLQFLGLVLLLAPPGMRGEELRYLRNLFCMTQTNFAKALGVPRRATIADWEGKDRIFAKPFTEIAPRLILLNLFKTHVLESEFCFLTDNHRATYENFTKSFVDQVQDLLGQQRNSRELNIHRRSRIAEWDGELLGV